MNIDTERIKLSNGHKAGLIVVGVFEIIFGLNSVGCAIAAISYRKSYLGNCYEYFYYKFPNYNSDLQPTNLKYNCNYYDWLLVYTTTAQGIWTGIMIVISASLNLRFASKPTKQTGSISGGFSVFAFILTFFMMGLESFAIDAQYNNHYYYQDYYDHYYYMLWNLHYSLLGLACGMFILTMTNMIISYVATGCYGCCCYKQQTSSVAPMNIQHNNEYLVSYQPQTVTAQIPFVTEQTLVGPQAFGTMMAQPQSDAPGQSSGKSVLAQPVYPQLGETSIQPHSQAHSPPQPALADSKEQNLTQHSAHPQPDISGQQPEW